MKMSAGTHCKGRLTRSLAGYEFSSTKATKSERMNRTFFTNSIISVEPKGTSINDVPRFFGFFDLRKKNRRVWQIT